MSTYFNLFGIHIDTITLHQALHRVTGWLADGTTGRAIFTPNPEIALRALHDKSYRAILNRADMLLPDGYGLVLASRILGGHLTERTTGVDFIYALLGYAQIHHNSVYILLLENGLTSAQTAREYCNRSFPGLTVWCQSVNHHYVRSGHIIEDIDTAAPDILIVTFGAPLQEQWILDALPRLSKVQIACAVGGAIDMLVGIKRRAPAIWRRLNIEWLWRLFLSPYRLRRIGNAVVVFSYHVFILWLKSRFCYRKNVLAFIFKNKNAILIIRKKFSAKHDGCWMLPQGGVEEHETEREALRREVGEEVGIRSLKIITCSRLRNRYRWPFYHRNAYAHRFAGQKQSCWFVKFYGNDSEVTVKNFSQEHIDRYMWVTQEKALMLIEPPRRKLFKKLITEFNEQKIYALS